MKLKQRFLHAVSNGDIGSFDDAGVIVTEQEMQKAFPEENSTELQRFLPSSVIEEGYTNASDNRFLFQINEATYRVHPDVLDSYELSYLDLMGDSQRLQ